jgi:hypothetical protein
MMFYVGVVFSYHIYDWYDFIQLSHTQMLFTHSQVRGSCLERREQRVTHMDYPIRFIIKYCYFATPQVAQSAQASRYV